ncbi:MAG: hypothetical protein JKY47_02285 [Thalassospira sp.]|jgi:hypothetical protein|nr:hypothetical protein [Thalassospira sp.]
MPDIFEQNAIAYEEAKRSLAELQDQSIALDFKIRACQRMIKTDPVAALFDQLDAIYQITPDNLDDFYSGVELFNLYADQIDLRGKASDQARYICFMNDLTIITCDPDSIRDSDIAGIKNRIGKTLDRLANAIWPSELLYGHRIQDASDYKVAFYPGAIYANDMFPICAALKEEGRSIDAGSLIPARQTMTEARRLTNAINRSLRVTPADAKEIVDALQIDEVAA